MKDSKKFSRRHSLLGTITLIGIVLGRRLSECNYLGAIFLIGNCQGVNARGVIVWGAIVQGAIILGGNCPEGNDPGGNCPR